MKLSHKHKERFSRKQREFSGSAVGFRIDEIRLHTGKKATREYLTHPGAVGVLAFSSRNKIILVKQFRYPVGEFTYEIPAGKLAKNEDPRACVGRELEEEAGYRAGTIKHLVSFWPTAAFSDEVIHVYLATNLRKTAVNPDEDEFLEIVEVTPTRMAAMIRSGRIRDSKTLIAFLYWKAFYQRRMETDTR